MIIATGNDLATGDVIWWTGSGWSRDVNAAVDVGHEGDAIIAREAAERNVNAAYLIEAQASGGSVRPAHIKDRIRALGPTVRLDLSLQPADPAAAERVI